MQCARKRWGAGTTCERPPNTPASNELQDRLAKMKAERESQDGMWLDSDSYPSEPHSSYNQTIQTQNGSGYSSAKK